MNFGENGISAWSGDLELDQSCDYKIKLRKEAAGAPVLLRWFCGRAYVSLVESLKDDKGGLQSSPYWHAGMLFCGAEDLQAAADGGNPALWGKIEALTAAARDKAASVMRPFEDWKRCNGHAKTFRIECKGKKNDYGVMLRLYLQEGATVHYCIDEGEPVVYGDVQTTLKYDKFIMEPFFRNKIRVTNFNFGQSHVGGENDVVTSEEAMRLALRKIETQREVLKLEGVDLADDWFSRLPYSVRMAMTERER